MSKLTNVKFNDDGTVSPLDPTKPFEYCPAPTSMEAAPLRIRQAGGGVQSAAATSLPQAHSKRRNITKGNGMVLKANAGSQDPSNPQKGAKT